MRATILTLVATGVLCAACVANDPYSEVAASCMTQAPVIDMRTNNIIKTYLTPECRAALDPAIVERERIRAEEGREATPDELPHFIPYDEENFSHAPEGFRDRVNEAFHALIAYPVAIPAKNTIFGTAPDRAGALPLDFFEIYRDNRWKNLNQSLFNYVFGKFDVVRYVSVLDGVSGHYDLKASGGLRELILTDNFWSSDRYAGSANYRMPFLRSAILVHEARHGDGYVHINCDSSKTSHTGFACDPELTGPYGFETAYEKFLLHGSATCIESSLRKGCTPPLSPVAVRMIGLDLCLNIQSRFMNLYPELLKLVKDGLSCSSLTYEKIMELEGIALPPQDIVQ